MPKKSANTKIFEKMLKEIKAKNIKVISAKGGEEIVDTQDLQFLILAPNSDEYDETNEYSIVNRLQYKNTSFLFTGDAEQKSEKEMIKKRMPLKANVLKIGHHGGRTSTTNVFLAQVAPTYAIISAGKDNDYGHPHKEVLERLNKAGVDIFRTDKNGTIQAYSDGNTIRFNCKPTEIVHKTKSNQYIGNKRSKVYHLPDCSSLPKPKNQIIFKSQQEAEKAGFKPCTRCKP
jgi:competence protein ComEC